MPEFRRITTTDLDLLNQFLTLLGTGAATFRYFAKRPVEVVLNNLYAALLITDQVPVAYGHLEREGDKLWLGVAVGEAYQGHGYGKHMVQHLIDVAKAQGEPLLTLTVDQVNKRAIQLYESLGFVRTAEKAHYYQYEYRLNT